MGFSRKNFETPILVGREPLATEKELEAASNASQLLSGIVNKFILRRTNTLLSKHLPPKLVQLVCVKLTPLQEALYRHIMDSKAMLLLLTGGKQTVRAPCVFAVSFPRSLRSSPAFLPLVHAQGVLSFITTLKKLCNHPRLIYEPPKGGTRGPGPSSDDIASLFPEGFHKDKSSMPWMSGKFDVLARMLALMRKKEGPRGPFTGDRIVIVSNYTQTLDLITVLCRENHYPIIRLDGSTTPAKRQKLVDQFNDRTRDEFVFLLSSKAGGCGLNLVGGNRLILFDPDWNVRGLCPVSCDATWACCVVPVHAVALIAPVVLFSVVRAFAAGNGQAGRSSRVA